MSPDEIKSVRRVAGMSQKDLAAALEIDVAVVRAWEKGEMFATRAHCDQMAALAANPPLRRSAAKERTPLQLLADPAFFTLVRKLLAHAPLRAAVEKLAEPYADPIDPADG